MSTTKNTNTPNAPAKAAHTPGPWRTNGPAVTAKESWNLVVCVLPAQDDWNRRADAAAPTRAEADANARLIAAAPDMLAVLLRFETACSEASRRGITRIPVGTLNSLWKDARAAIAKATGGNA